MSDKKLKFDGDQQSIHWEGKLCIHVGECGRAKGDLFVGGRKPWCEPDQVSIPDAARVVQACPTGALTQHMADGTPMDEPLDETNSVHVASDGPLYVRGDLEIQGAPDAMPGLKRRAALCRCGHSKNKPFCDGAHKEAGFREYGAVGESGLDQIETGGPLKITAFDDGPIEASGNLEIYAGTGRKAWQGRKVYLCRCGASKNKPFCDGQHKVVGFKS